MGVAIKEIQRRDKISITSLALSPVLSSVSRPRAVRFSFFPPPETLTYFRRVTFENGLALFEADHPSSVFFGMNNATRENRDKQFFMG